MQKEHEREGEGRPTAELKAKIEGDLDKQWVWGGMRSRRGCMGWTKWIQKETLRREK